MYSEGLLSYGQVKVLICSASVLGDRPGLIEGWAREVAGGLGDCV
jgi:hypothetical protein